MSRPSVYFATTSDHALLTTDDIVAVSALAQRGHDVRPLVWSSCSPRDIPAGSILIMRSVWDYHLRKSEFQRWLAELAECDLRVFNPLPLIKWNLDKTYLADLASAGVDVIPTAWSGRSSMQTLSELMREAGWTDVIIKPTVSASAYMTSRVNGLGAAHAAEASFRSLRSRGDVMLQPYLDEITTQGEWSLIFFGGKFSHAVVKTPAPGDFRVQVDFGGSIAPATPPAHVLRAGTAVANALPYAPLYARIDGVEVSGKLLLMEAECIDPVLYFGYDADAAHAFADCLEQLINQVPPKGAQRHACQT